MVHIYFYLLTAFSQYGWVPKSPPRYRNRDSSTLLRGHRNNRRVAKHLATAPVGKGVDTSAQEYFQKNFGVFV